MNAGLIGCGNISGAYLRASRLFPILNITKVADLNPAIAAARAKEYSNDTRVIQAVSVDELLADDATDLIINLTIPATHAEVSERILAAGKHTYSEKPLALTFAKGQHLLDAAKHHNRRLGCAPDTFLGAGLQSCRKIIDDGWIGEPMAAMGFFVTPGPESWHPNPNFFYQEGAGPLFDIGPYHITAMVHLFGPIQSVMGQTSAARQQRVITSKEKYGQLIEVNVPTHVSAGLLFASGVNTTFVTSFDVGAHELPHLEIYGTEGVLSAPDPNQFGGNPRVRRLGSSTWHEVPLVSQYTTECRGIGAADMATALTSGREHRSNGELALHVLEALENIIRSHETGQRLNMTTTPFQPTAIPLGLLQGVLDD